MRRDKGLSAGSGLLGCGIMLRIFIAVAWLSLSAAAAERSFEFTAEKENETPRGFRSVVSGAGQPGDWRIVMDAVPSALPPVSPSAPVTSKRPVVGQMSRETTDEHFPLLISDEESYGDFTATVKVKAVGGGIEQMAGLAFRIQDEKNYYVVRVSAMGNSFRFYKFVKGVRSAPIGPETPVALGVWHELTVECKGNEIRCRLNGKELIPPLKDSSFSAGKVGFWTKSDSVSYFTDLKVTYKPRESFARGLVRETMQRSPRLLGLKIFGTPDGQNGPLILASTNEKELGQPGTKTEKDCIDKGAVFFAKGIEEVQVTMPLHDRNGDKVAAVRIIMRTFAGQTEKNAIARALPIIKAMEQRVVSAKELME